MTDTAIYDLPPEVHTHILMACAPRDIESLGATCHTMRAAARDLHLWRRLFERDYGHLYPTRSGHARWPTNGVLCDPWVDALCDEWGIGTPSIRLPPPGEAWVPQPFMHMQSTGKDARWLYAFHATSRHTSGDRTPFACASSDNYVVTFSCFPATWTESADCSVFAWKVTVDDIDIICSNFPKRNLHSHVKIDRVGRHTRWLVGDLACPAATFFVKGLQTVPQRSDLDRSGQIEARGAKVRQRFEYSDGSATDQILNGKNTHCAVTRYPNGDRVHYSLIHGRVTQIDKFVCSETCPVAEFAGRSICPAGWAWATATLGPGDSNEHYYWPKGECDDALAFRDYVLRDLIGWHPLLREIALAHIDDT
ncbi:F-box domain containing protein [Pandoravirus salinus]|uniref:F-box domain containing protein n=1 Tax=Pandoravirus salinus TaxID=1349410 RepID=S4W1R7_9VIRU|nr:F-box domain [Pandoravirus salinus]AGO85751.1 F-box domain containing protein [Pandoravirus salinus]